MLYGVHVTGFAYDTDVYASTTLRDNMFGSWLSTVALGARSDIHSLIIFAARMAAQSPIKLIMVPNIPIIAASAACPSWRHHIPAMIAAMAGM